MTAPLKKYVIIPETMTHRPTHVTVTDTKEHYPENKRWPVDPDVAKGGVSIVTQEGK